MDVAIVTGASSTLGLAISRRLIDLGFRVYGLGGNFADIPLRNSAFVPVNCNLADPGQVEGCAREIIAKEHAVCLLVNNAKLYPPEDLTQATTDQLERSLAVNLLCPLILVREALPGLQRLQGQIVNVASATPETGRGGPTGAATAGALRWMGEQLFQQVRETGVKVTTISPEPNRWRPADSMPAPGQRPQSVIDPDAVAACVADLVSNRSGNVITEIVLRPQRIVEKPQAPVRELPYPKPQPIPYTVPRAEIEAEEQLDEEREVAQERREGRDQPPAQGEEGGRRGRRRGRRRGKGGRAREDAREAQSDRPEGEKPSAKEDEKPQPRDDAEQKQRPEPDARPSHAPRQEAEPPAVSVGSEGSDGSRRKRRRKPRPSSMDIRADRPPFATDSAGPKSFAASAPDKPQDAAGPRPAPDAPAHDALSKSDSAVPQGVVGADGPAQAAAAPVSDTPVPAKRAAKKAAKKGVKSVSKKAAKKAVKKAVRKALKKSAAKKSAVKKSATKKAAAKRAARKSAN